VVIIVEVRVCLKGRGDYLKKGGRRSNISRKEKYLVRDRYCEAIFAVS
jgi:hypothetical protein